MRDKRAVKPKVLKLPRSITNLRWHAIYAVAVLGLFGTIGLGWFGVGQRVGDGTGFYVMYFAWAENFTPYSTERVGQKFVDYVTPRPDWEGNKHYYSPGNPMRRADGTADESHFWLYSMLAAVFYWPLKLLGADVGLGFNCLHIVLLYVAVVLMHRRLGPAAACSLVLLVVGSPVLWYANKAHTELFTVVLGSLGAAYLVAGEHARSALCFALVATQNPAFGLIALLVLALGLVSRGWKRPAADWRILAVVAAVLALHPVYYWFRRHAFSPMLAGPELIFHSYFLPLRHMLSFWIDPDIGLLATWPLGLPLLVAGIVMFARQRSRRRIEYAAFFVLSSFILTWCYARLSTVFGRAGSVDVSRYSVWLIFLFFPILWKLILWLAQGFDRHITQRRIADASGGTILSSRRASKPRNQALGDRAPHGRLKDAPPGPPALRQIRPVQRLAMIAGLTLIGSSAWLYRPWLDEISRRPTPGSNWLYANLSGWYDPLPRIFYDCRGGRLEKSGEDVSRWSDWAVSDASGNKILVWREAFDRQRADAPAAVAGRGCLDPQAVYQAAQERFARYPTAEFCYINRRGQELFGPPPLPLGHEMRLTRQGHSERFLASGWYPPEENGTWSRGDRAELIFAPQGIETGQRYAIHLQIAEVARAGIGPRMIELSLNGLSLGLAELRGPAMLGWVVSGEKLQAATTLSLEIRDPLSPRQARHGSDTRQLGVKVASLQIQLLPPPPAAAVAKNPQQQGQSATGSEPGRQQGKPAAGHPSANSGKQQAQ